MTTDSEGNKRKIFLVEGDLQYRNLCREWLHLKCESRGLDADINDLFAEDLNGTISRENPDLVLLNCWGDKGVYSDSEILDFISRIKGAKADVRIYLLGCDNNTGTKAINSGALGYSSSPYASPDGLAESLAGRLV